MPTNQIIVVSKDSETWKLYEEPPNRLSFIFYTHFQLYHKSVWCCFDSDYTIIEWKTAQAVELQVRTDNIGTICCLFIELPKVLDDGCVGFLVQKKYTRYEDTV